MKDMRFDVAIIGAGPAGAWLARELSRAGVSAALYERSAVAGEPNFSSGGSLRSVIEQFQLSPTAVASSWDMFELKSPGAQKQWHYDSPVGIVFDFRTLKETLINEAKDHGAHIFLGTHVRGIEAGGDSSRIITTESGAASHQARIIVDASGPAGVIASAIGIRKRIPALPSTGLEVIVETKSAPAYQSRCLSIYFGHAYAPHGYAWIFPMGGALFKIGVCVYQQARYRESYNLDRILDGFISEIPWLQNMRIVEKHGGMLYANGGVRRHVLGNVIAIGDAADQVNPLGGEGIRHVLQSAAFAKEVILEALGGKGIAHLGKYDVLWKGYVGWRWAISKKVTEWTYPYLADRGWDRLTRVVSRMSSKEIFDFLFLYKLRPVWAALWRY